MTTPPALPPRERAVSATPAASNDAFDDAEPPPPYEAIAGAGEATLEHGPLRPFQQVPPPQQTHAPPTVPPPQFPFWNGANLTPQQTGFSEGPVHPANANANSGHHANANPGYPGRRPASAQPSLPQRPNDPNALIPIDDYHPKLRNGQILVYPLHQARCPKCLNTGYKNNDPTHPCRKCWDKYGRPYNSAVKVSIRNGVPPNYQRPLRTAPPRPAVPPRPRPQIIYQQPSMGQMFNPFMPFMPTAQAPQPPPGALVVQPGDPRLGGVLCNKCYGSGVTQAFLFDTETCYKCGGVGRVF